MTNAELIEALQNCANVNYEYRAEGASCSKCPYKGARYCKRTMMRAAADALEAADAHEKAWSKKCERLEARIADLGTALTAYRARKGEQIPKEGYWIPNSPFTGNCSECGGNGNLKDNYCSSCGARMSAECPVRAGCDKFVNAFFDGSSDTLRLYGQDGCYVKGELVTCGECKHYKDGMCYNPNTYDDEKTCGNTTADWFCADGKRKDGV